MITSLLYLHGFASSPDSTKAAILRSRLAAFGISLHAPDFNQPDFATLTVTRMLEQTFEAIEALPAGPCALIGSSLGGFVAVHAAARQNSSTRVPITGLVLLAPAFDFGANRMRQLGPGGLDRWKSTNRLEVFHYGYGEVRPVQYALYEDAQRYDAYSLKLATPAVIIYGSRDESVDPKTVERWAVGRPNVRLVRVEDGHQLTNSVEVIWKETAALAGLKI